MDIIDWSCITKAGHSFRIILNLIRNRRMECLATMPSQTVKKSPFSIFSHNKILYLYSLFLQRWYEVVNGRQCL